MRSNNILGSSACLINDVPANITDIAQFRTTQIRIATGKVDQANTWLARYTRRHWDIARLRVTCGSMMLCTPPWDCSRRPSPVRDMHDVKTSNKKVIAAANSSRVSIAFKKISTKAEFFFSFSLIIQESYHAGVCIRGIAKILRLRAQLIFPLRKCSLAR